MTFDKESYVLQWTVGASATAVAFTVLGYLSENTGMIELFITDLLFSAPAKYITILFFGDGLSFGVELFIASLIIAVIYAVIGCGIAFLSYPRPQ